MSRWNPDQSQEQSQGKLQEVSGKAERSESEAESKHETKEEKTDKKWDVRKHARAQTDDIENYINFDIMLGKKRMKFISQMHLDVSQEFQKFPQPSVILWMCMFDLV